MEGDEGMKTLECLRGRLLAERQASRVAKEDAEFMGKKVTFSLKLFFSILLAKLNLEYIIDCYFNALKMLGSDDS